MARLVLILAALLASTLQPSVAAAQTSITLLAATSRETGANGGIRIGDVAIVEGPDAATVREIVVESSPVAAAGDTAGTTRVSVSDIRAAIERGGMSPGRITVRGSVCIVRCGNEQAPDERKRDEDQGSSRFEVVAVDGPPTVRTTVARHLASLYGVGPSDLRLAFESKDSSFLGTRAATGQPSPLRIDVEPVGSASSARLPVRVFIYEGDQLKIQRMINVRPEVRRAVVKSMDQIERGQPIAASQVAVESAPVAPSSKPPAALTEIVGTNASARIPAGRVISRDDIAAAIACKRGDLVWVHCLSGSVRVQAKARAMATARDGELVLLKLEGAEETFTARMSGKGRAVLRADEESVSPTAALSAADNAAIQESKR